MKKRKPRQLVSIFQNRATPPASVRCIFEIASNFGLVERTREKLPTLAFSCYVYRLEYRPESLEAMPYDASGLRMAHERIEEPPN
ncbi:MAG: hypothetical protein HY895_13770 [Deltaproteobacteria bacterium]|nr:hypothetical protein [Deltaproteobacteria bacterium]